MHQNVISVRKDASTSMKGSKKKVIAENMDVYYNPVSKVAEGKSPDKNMDEWGGANEYTCQHYFEDSG